MGDSINIIIEIRYEIPVKYSHFVWYSIFWHFSKNATSLGLASCVLFIFDLRNNFFSQNLRLKIQNKIVFSYLN